MKNERKWRDSFRIRSEIIYSMQKNLLNFCINAVVGAKYAPTKNVQI